MRVKETYQQMRTFITKDIRQINLDELTKAKRRLVRFVNVIKLTLNTFSKEKLGIQAVALSFFGTMAVVPFIFLAFLVTDGFGLSDKLMALVHEYFSGSQEIIDMLIGFADNIFSTARNSVMGLASALLFCWSVLWMMFSVERAFNNVWRVHKSRKIYKRIGFYFLIIFVTPFILMLFFSGSIIYTNALANIGLGVEYFRTLSSILAWVIFAVIAILIFSVMYKFIPNHKVHYSHALKASIVSGLVFTVFQYIYLETQMFITRLNTVYGAVAMIPFFMLWMNIGWFIILFGAELSYGFQKVDERIKHKAMISGVDESLVEVEMDAEILNGAYPDDDGSDDDGSEDVNMKISDHGNIGKDGEIGSDDDNINVPDSEKTGNTDDTENIEITEKDGKTGNDGETDKNELNKNNLDD